MFEFIGFIIVSILGTLFHFVYNSFNKNKHLAYYFSVNESTWEHIKLALGPSFLWLPIQLHHYSFVQMTFPKVISLISIIIIIPMLYYGYKRLTHKDITIINISIFFIAVALSQIIFVIINSNYSYNIILFHFSFVILMAIFLSYLTLTFTPYHNRIFKDPITNTYGIK